jgi:hypothetical protein
MVERGAMVTHGVDSAVGEGGDEDGPGGVGLAPRFDDLGDARRPSAGLDDCARNRYSKHQVAAADGGRLTEAG